MTVAKDDRQRQSDRQDGADGRQYEARLIAHRHARVGEMRASGRPIQMSSGGRYTF